MASGCVVLPHAPLGAAFHVVGVVGQEDALHQRDRRCLAPPASARPRCPAACGMTLWLSTRLGVPPAGVPARLPAPVTFHRRRIPLHIEEAVAGPRVGAVHHFLVDKAIGADSRLAGSTHSCSSVRSYQADDAAPLAVEDEPVAGRLDHGVFGHLVCDRVLDQVGAAHDGVAEGRHRHWRDGGAFGAQVFQLQHG